MKKSIQISVLCLFIFTSISYSQSTRYNFKLSHDVFNDYNPNLVIPPFVYYPPTADNPLLYTNVNISNNSPAPQNEPSIKISHKNPNRVVAAWRDFRIGFNPAVRRVGYSYSTDGGATWSASALLDSTLLGGGLLRNSDASVTVDTAGNFYITTIGLNNSNGNTVLAVYKSTDGGVTFPTGMILAQGQNEDKEMITSDLTPGSPYRNNIYISWSRLANSADIKCIRSTNDGATWLTPVNVGTAGTSGQGSDITVGANGEVYVIWTDYNSQYFSKSTDGGATFSTPISIASGPSANIPWGQTGNVTFPSIAADITGGARNGYIYATWCDGRNDGGDIFLSRSTNHGSTWSTALRVNNDPVGNGKIQAWPWIAVNDSGKIAIAFFDTRNTPSNTTIEAWLARSDDGGLTFTNEVMSSQQSPTSTPNTDVRYGDYIGVDFWTTKITPAWTDERAGGFNMEIYTAVIDITTGIEPVAGNLPTSYTLEQNYPNPFNPSTNISFSIPEKTNISLEVYDIDGRLIENIVSKEYSAGIHSVTWDASRFASGVYFYKLSSSNGYSLTKKMMLIK